MSNISINKIVDGNSSLNNFSPNINPTSRSPKKNTENGKILSTINNRFKQLKLKYGEDIVDPERSPERIKNKEMQKQSMQRSNILYEKAILKNEFTKIVMEKSLEIKNELEIKSCTFQPKVNRNLQKFININRPQTFNPRNVYDRQYSLMMNSRQK